MLKANPRFGKRAFERIKIPGPAKKINIPSRSYFAPRRDSVAADYGVPDFFLP